MTFWRVLFMAVVALGANSSAGAARLPPGFVRLAEIAPTIVQDVRYAVSNNFTGRPVPGYDAADCWARRETAEALARVAKDAAAKGLLIIAFDCYRPQRATDAFVRWSNDPADQIAKAAFYPHIDKQHLFARGYIGSRSSHSAGVAVDVGLLRENGSALDFGSSFDLFDPRSATDSPLARGEARRNRDLLKALMEEHGFANYPREWWHYTFRGVADPVFYDFPITRGD